jgi:hypothetical protein
MRVTVSSRCPSGRIEVELCHFVVETAVWPGRAVRTGTLAPLPSISLVSKSA